MKVYDLQSVCTGYGKTYVLHDLHLSVASGEFVGIIGPNGSGKSTLLKTLVAVLSPGIGKVLFQEQSLSLYTKNELAKNISFVPQFIENLVAFTVYDFVKTGRFPFRSFFLKDPREDLEVVEESLQLAGVTGLRDKLITELSGGELQLVSIARALAQSKKVMLLDEPVSSLDYHHAVKIMDVLHNLHAMGTTIITVLHNINLASDYCSRIVSLKQGRVFFDGSPEESINEKNIGELFDIQCKIVKSPVSGKPYVYTFPGYTKL